MPDELIKEPLRGEVLAPLPWSWSVRNEWGDWGQPKPEKLLDPNDPLKRTPKQIVEASNA